MYVFIFRTSHIVSWRFAFLLGEIGRQVAKAPLTAAINPYLMATIRLAVRETRNRPRHREQSGPSPELAI